MMKTRTVAFILMAFYAFASGGWASAQELTVSSKKFTENVILADIAALSGQAAGVDIIHKRELGGTRILWNALLSGEIDMYPEYTGTIRSELFGGSLPDNIDSIRSALAEKGIGVIDPLGFNNTYALGMQKETASELGIAKISDLRNHPDLRFGFSNEFMDREDGWPSLRDTYRLPQRNVVGLDHDLSYQGLESGTIQLTDMYSTDAEIAYYDLQVLQDDLGLFPKYDALFVYRLELEDSHPTLIATLREMAGSISEPEMVAMNARSKIDKLRAEEVAAEYLAKTRGLDIEIEEITLTQRLWATTAEHLYLVLVSLTAAILIAIPLGILAAKFKTAGQVILSIVGVMQTIPSLALLVFMIPLLGIGGPPAIVALFIYSLLPIVRNTHSGLQGIQPSLIDSAKALGLPARARLFKIELPLAARSILSGVKTSAVINIGTATLGALIGAGGYGQPILTGIRLDDTALILEGALPAALLAVLAQYLFEFSERLVVSKGLRL